MTTHDKDKIIAAAKEAGCNAGYLGSFYNSTEALERLYAKGFEDGRVVEREECADILSKTDISRVPLNWRGCIGNLLATYAAIMFKEYEMTYEEWVKSVERGVTINPEMAFKAGAASRDAEVVSLTNQRDYEYVRAENAEQERAQFEQESDQLREHVTMLRDALLTCSVGDFSTGHVIHPSFDTKLPEARANVFDAIGTERHYQEIKWGDLVDHPQSVGAYLTLMRVHLARAENAWVGANNDVEALDCLRKVLAIGVACGEQHGMPCRPDTAPTPHANPFSDDEHD